MQLKVYFAHSVHLRLISLISLIFADFTPLLPSNQSSALCEVEKQ